MTYPRHRASSAGRVDHDPYTVFRRAFKTNQTTDVIAFSVPTATPPTTATAGVHELESGKKLILYPYGTAADNKEFRVGVQLWFPMYDKVESVRSSEDVAWIPVAAAVLDCTTNNSIKSAAAAGPIATTDFFCDIIALAAGTAQGLVTRGADDFISSTDTPTLGGSSVTIDTSGAKYVQFFIDKDGTGSAAATSANTLFAVI